MFTRENFNFLNYIKKEPLSGSYQGMRYLFMKKQENEEVFMLGITWPEPLGYAKTPKELKVEMQFTLDEDGMQDAIAWLNSRYEDYRDRNRKV